VRCEGWGQRYPQEPAYALVTSEDSCLQPVRRHLHLLREFDDLLARLRQAVTRGQLFEHLDPEPSLELSDASQHRRVVHPEAFSGGPDRAPTRGGKKVANIVPVDHGAASHHRVRLPKVVSNASNSISYVGSKGCHRSPVPNGGHRML